MASLCSLDTVPACFRATGIANETSKAQGESVRIATTAALASTAFMAFSTVNTFHNSGKPTPGSTVIINQPWAAGPCFMLRWGRERGRAEVRGDYSKPGTPSPPCVPYCSQPHVPLRRGRGTEKAWARRGRTGPATGTRMQPPTSRIHNGLSGAVPPANRTELRF